MIQKNRIIRILLMLSSTQAAIEDVGFCGDCHCVPEPGEDCPVDSIPQVKFSTTVLSTLQSIALENPIALTCNPFSDDSCDTDPPLEQGEACVAEIIVPTDTSQCPEGFSYRLVTVESLQDAKENGDIITHEGPCGTCSSFQDLAIYMDQPDLSSLALNCATQAIFTQQNGIDCFMEAGFSEACAETWVYKVLTTNSVCGSVCTSHAFSGDPDFGPSPTCELVECLECDENNVGPVFKKIAGRNRRNSGLLSGLVRKCEQLADVVHIDPCGIFRAGEDACDARKAIDEDIGQDYGTVCKCNTIGDEVKLSCVDTLCFGCNDEMSVCAEFSFGDIFSSDGNKESSFTQMDYIHGELSDQLVFTEADGICSVTVNGEECDQCSILSCEDGFKGLEVQCANVLGGEDFNSCLGQFSTDGFFQVFNAGEFNECVTPGEVGCHRDRVEEELQGTSFGTRCECSKGDKESILTCIDTTSKYCGTVENICSQYGYGFKYLDGSLSYDSRFEIFEYIEGRAESRMTFEYFTDTCSASVDGIECTACENVDCNNGEFSGREVKCSNVQDGANITECDLSSTEDSVFEALNFGPDSIQRTPIAEESCRESSLGEDCTCTESDVPGSPLAGGNFELECDTGEVCHCNAESEVEACVSYEKNQKFDPLYGSVTFIEDVAKYTLGSSDEVRLEMTSCDADGAGCEFGFMCSLKVNGEYCSECKLCSEYTGGFNEGVDALGISFDCSDIEEGAVYDLCLDSPVSVSSGVFRFLSNNDVCPDKLSCGALFTTCDYSTDCCSGRCLNNQCRTATRTRGKTTLKLGGSSRGGAAGKRNRVRGL